MSEKLEELKGIFRNNLRQGYSNILTDEDLTWLIKKAEKEEKQQEIIESQTRVLNDLTKDTARLVARNLVAWDTSKDKRDGLLPEVYFKNKVVYLELTGEEYRFGKAIEKFNIGD